MATTFDLLLLTLMILVVSLTVIVFGLYIIKLEDINSKLKKEIEDLNRRDEEELFRFKEMMKEINNLENN